MHAEHLGPSILERIAEGESVAWTECLDRYGGLVSSLARRFSKTAADVEDAKQDVFFNIWRHASRFDRSQGSEVTFVALLTRRRLIDRLRRAASEPITAASSFDALEPVACLEVAPETAADASRALEVLATLRPAYRHVLELGYLHGLSQSQIAARMNIPIGTVKSYMRRGLTCIRDEMRTYGIIV